MKCETCLYNKNCQYLAKHPHTIVEDCSAYENAGEWKKVQRGYWYTDYARQPLSVCSNCDLSNGNNRTKYCPHCGARMDGGRENDL